MGIKVDGRGQDKEVAIIHAKEPHKKIMNKKMVLEIWLGNPNWWIMRIKHRLRTSQTAGPAPLPWQTP